MGLLTVYVAPGNVKVNRLELMASGDACVIL